ncbi:MAG: hypothetical protein COA96_06930 [SAR86 cluster bacterium]|uniref:Uncharacterized protein n=1 Tax=SAR86 cluster bacterium TaxID=2030880 RepID=A0A2A5B2F7_9GAMM|nr:MAG: hypothetical protein COA96_06930 [SAR86 cluster bacterium]
MSKSSIRYALREITLIVLGILIAFAINNWNEQRQYEKHERLLLNEIHSSLIRYRELIDNFYTPRLELKETSIAKLTNLAGEGARIDEAEFVELIRRSRIDFIFRFDTGAYDALKISGFDKLSNNALRANLIDMYDVRLPAYLIFITKVNELSDQMIIPLMNDFLSEKLVLDENQEWSIQLGVIDENVLGNRSFLRVLRLETLKAENQKSRLDTVIEFTDQLALDIAAELEL